MAHYINMAYYTDHPALPRPIDRAIEQARGSTVALDATPGKLAASKMTPALSLKEIIEEKTRENGRLRAELAYYHEVGALGDALYGEVHDAAERLRLALITYHRGRNNLRKTG